MRHNSKHTIFLHGELPGIVAVRLLLRDLLLVRGTECVYPSRCRLLPGRICFPCHDSTIRHNSKRTIFSHGELPGNVATGLLLRDLVSVRGTEWCVPVCAAASFRCRCQAAALECHPMPMPCTEVYLSWLTQETWVLTEKSLVFHL